MVCFCGVFSMGVMIRFDWFGCSCFVFGRWCSFVEYSSSWCSFLWSCPVGVVIQWGWLDCFCFILGGGVLSWGCPVGVMI